MTVAIEMLASQSVSPIYAMNFDRKDASIPSLLEDVPFHIAPGTNRFIEPSSGINVPSFYLSKGLSFSEVHPEDGYLDSCNLVRWGTEGAEKLWLFIELDYSKHFCDALVKAIDDMRKKGGDVSSWLEGCAFPPHHKNLMVTPRFVKELGIQAQVVCHRRGRCWDLSCLSSVPYCLRTKDCAVQSHGLLSSPASRGG